MSYREENGQVVLTMSREDYERVLLIFGGATACAADEPARWALNIEQMLLLLNRLNEGNPNYTPYEVADNQQRDGETLGEWTERCGKGTVAEILKRERERYGVKS